MLSKGFSFSVSQNSTRMTIARVVDLEEIKGTGV